ncbi:hypothetical protein FJ987_23265 [Mesorhizobium sp. CU2]|nr:hypothetical protein FJ988_26290 [Mesorhizobium sp. CU3]TPO08752.1 hypothetical protein FJ987_23265 [Mesorhizobium sp. CU2]
MRQHMLNGWLLAALIALVCLLGITAYIEVKKDLPRVACRHNPEAPGKMAAPAGGCTAVCCGSASPSV